MRLAVPLHQFLSRLVFALAASGLAWPGFAASTLNAEVVGPAGEAIEDAAVFLVPVSAPKPARHAPLSAAVAQRDREFKLWLYSRRGVLEYWIIIWMERRVEIYRRDDAHLKLYGTLYQNDTLQSPHLPGFSCQLDFVHFRFSGTQFIGAKPIPCKELFRHRLFTLMCEKSMHPGNGGSGQRSRHWTSPMSYSTKRLTEKCTKSS